jgi:YebC/PmpR family DNA-binding regulatory protein
MSGHSKWHSIRHKKAAVDAKRGKIFTKLIRELTISAKLGGDDPDNNARLRLAINNARNANMPNDNIKKAIKKGAGSGSESDSYEEALYEGYLPHGVAVIIQCLTDNRNRTVADVRSILTKNGGSMGEANSVAYMFDRKGQINIEADKIAEEELLELVTEANAEDMQTEEEGYTIYTDVNDFDHVVKALEEKKIETAFSNLVMVPQNTIDLSADECEKIDQIVEKLEDCDDVQHVFSNHRQI